MKIELRFPLEIKAEAVLVEELIAAGFTGPLLEQLIASKTAGKME